MAKHEGGWWLMTVGKIGPIDVGLDSAIRVIGAEVQFKQVGIPEGQCKACWDAER